MKHEAPSSFDPRIMLIDEKKYIGTFLPNVSIIGEDGKTRKLYDIINNKPTIMTLIFYDCKTGCPLIIHSLAEITSKIKRDFNVLVLSFNKDDNTNILIEFKKEHLHHIDNRWKWGTMEEKDIETLTKSIGFRFFYSKKDETFVHPIVLIFSSPEGKIVRYLFGSNPKKDTVDIAIKEASISKFSFNSLIDLAFLVCYTYDYKSSSYQMNIIPYIGLLGIIFISLAIVLSLIYKKKNEVG
ncbi:MAG: SCO family protein [Brevinematia bacterium]